MAFHGLSLGRKENWRRNSQDSPKQAHFFFLPLPAMVIKFLLLQPWNDADPSRDSPGGFCAALGLHHWSFMFHLRLQLPEWSVYDFLCSPAWDGHCGIINPMNVWDSLTILFLWPYVMVWWTAVPTGSAGGTVWEGHGNMVNMASLIKRRITWSQASTCEGVSRWSWPRR